MYEIIFQTSSLNWCNLDDEILEFSRGIRLHFEKISGDFFYRDICKAQLGVAHLYSQSKMKLNLEKADSQI